MEELILGKEELLRKWRERISEPLEDDLDIPDVVLLIKDFEKEIDFLKRLKKKRLNQIDEEIQKHENKIDFFKDVIRKTLKSNNEKSKKYPGICRISLKKRNPIWEIENEDELKKYIKEEAPEEYEKVIKVEEKIKKKEVNSLLDTWKSIDKLPDCVRQDDSKEESLTVTMLLDEEKSDVKDTEDIPRKFSMDDLEELSFVDG